MWSRRDIGVCGLLLAYWQTGVCAFGKESVVRLPMVEGAERRFAHIYSDESASPRNIRQIVQDEQGFVWFGTQDGLKRFDGYHFRDYRHENGNDASLSGTSIAALFKDRSGRLWVASDQFLDRYDPVTERFTHYRSDPHDSRLFQGEVNQINQDSAGIIWLATTNGLVGLDPATNQSVKYHHRDGDAASLSGNQVKSTFEEKDGTFWVASTNGLDVFDRPTGRVSARITLQSEGNKSEAGQPIRLFVDHTGVLWLSSAYGPGLAAVDRVTRRLVFYTFLRAAQKDARDGVQSLQEDRYGNLWMASPENGLLMLDRDRKAFVRYRNNPANPDSLTTNRVLSLYEDRERNLWVGTQGGGINRCSVSPAPFTRYRHEDGNPNSLETNEVTSVFEDSRDILWVGNRVALNRIDRKTGRYTTYRTAGGAGNLSSTYILSIAEDRSGSLWFGASGGGLNRLDRHTGRFKAYRHNPADLASLSDDIVYCLFVDRKGDLWAGTSDGLDRYDPATDRFQVYREVGPGTSSYRTISQDSAGNLWLSTVVAGVHRFNEDTGQFTTYRHTASPLSLSNDWVNAVCIDHSGIVWAGTLSGLNRMDPATGVFRAFFERDGLANDNVSSIVEDAQGDLWMGTNKGLSRFSPRANRFRNYYASDGIAGNELYRRNGAFRSSRGELFFSSTSGLTSFFPDRVVDNSYIPPVVLTDFLLSGEPAPVGGKSPLSQSISFTKSLTLQPDQNIFSFEFAALSYESPERNRYRYRLEGLEKSWTEKDSYHRTVMYTTLPARTYTFRVQGSNNRGGWNEVGVSVVVRILPPWWKTWWFGAVCTVALLVSTWYAHRFRLMQIARQLNLRFEERLAERTRIAQELHDTLLQGIAGASMYLHMAADSLPAGSALNEPLTRALDNLTLVQHEGRNAVQGLRLSYLDDEKLDEAFSRIPKDLAIRDDAVFRVVVEGDPQSLHPMVRDEVYSIGREAILNAFRHSGAKTIAVEIEYAREHLRITICDDGCGIDSKILRMGRDGHWGLVGMRERAARINARFTLHSQAGIGTEIVLCIPGRNAFRRPGNSGTRWFSRQIPQFEGSGRPRAHLRERSESDVQVRPGEKN